MGAHVIKVGLSPLVIDALERGIISAVAMVVLVTTAIFVPTRVVDSNHSGFCNIASLVMVVTDKRVVVAHRTRFAESGIESAGSPLVARW